MKDCYVNACSAAPKTPNDLLRDAEACSIPPLWGGLRMMASPRQLFEFYRQGFRSMVLGRTLWKIVALKLFLMFAVLKLLFFSNFLEKNFHSDAERSAHVLDNLTKAVPR